MQYAEKDGTRRVFSGNWQLTAGNFSSTYVADEAQGWALDDFALPGFGDGDHGDLQAHLRGNFGRDEDAAAHCVADAGAALAAFAQGAGDHLELIGPRGDFELHRGSFPVMQS